jgi:hypothetical protein
MKPRVDALCVERLKNLVSEQDGGEYGVFNDGIIDVGRYNDSKLRILWVLKEAVSDYGRGQYDLDLIEKNSEDNCFCLTLRMMAYVSCAILDGITTWKDIPELDRGSDVALKQIAIINVKKTPGGRSSSSDAIVKAFGENKGLVLGQIEVYDPHVIVMGFPNACETIVTQIVDNFDQGLRQMAHCGDCAHLMGKRWLYLWAYHPSSPGNSEVKQKRYCEDILRAVALNRPGLESL